MKTASTLLCAATFIFASVSCDSHTFKETQVLHEGMHKHDDHGHGDDHGKGHGEKKEEAHGEKAHAPEAAKH